MLRYVIHKLLDIIFFFFLFVGSGQVTREILIIFFPNLPGPGSPYHTGELIWSLFLVFYYQMSLIPCLWEWKPRASKRDH